MRRCQRKYVDALAVGALLIAVVCVSHDALAYHTEQQRITDRTAYTMPQDSFRLGIFKMEWAMWDSFTAKTYWLPWFLPAPNLQFKWRPINTEKFACALDFGFFSLDTQSIRAFDSEVGSAQIVTLPIELLGSYRFDATHTLSASLAYTAVNVDGDIKGEAFSGIGEGAVENAQFSGTYELRVSRVTALNLTGRMVLFQRFSGAASTVFQPDDYTTVEVFGGASASQNDLVGAWSLIADTVISGDIWNLRLGLGYGHYNLPGFNFVLAEKTVFPSFDLYLIFD